MAWLDRTARGLFLTEFISAFMLAMRYFFSPKMTVNYPYEKARLALALEGSMRFAATLMVRKDVLHVNCVKLSVLLRPSQLKLAHAIMTAPAVPFAMTLTW